MTDPDRPIGLKNLAHVCYYVEDLERTVAFYCGVLGMREAFDYTEDGRRIGVYVHVGGRGFIEFYQKPFEPTRGEQRGPYRHLALEVLDIDAAVAELRRRGVEVTDPKVGTDRARQAWLADPEGNRIELHCYSEQSWQSEALERLGGA